MGEERHAAAVGVRREQPEVGLGELVEEPQPQEDEGRDLDREHQHERAHARAIRGLLGSLALALSGLLVVNMIMAILGQQKRQIGMMKAVGASALDVVGVYLVMAGIYGVVALVIAVPFSLIRCTTPVS